VAEAGVREDGLIGLHYPTDDVRLAVTYNGLTLNNPADPEDSTYELNGSSIAPQYDTIEDPNTDDDGTEAYKVKKVKLVIQVDGTIRAQSYGDLFDKIKALTQAFDPAKVSHENASTWGFLAFDFSTPTLDKTNYATGLVPSRYYARCRGLHIPAITEYTGLSSFFRLELECIDPRRYLQTTSSLAGTGTADNSLADYRSLPTITITMAGAGSATYTITRTGTGIAATTKALVLNLSGMVNNDVVVVDMAAHQITKNGVVTPSLAVSPTANSWFEIEPTSQTITITNGTNATTSTVWRRAFCA
jgi:hypothetical protein